MHSGVVIGPFQQSSMFISRLFVVAATAMAMTYAEQTVDQLPWEQPACVNFWTEPASTDSPIAVRELFSVPKDLAASLKPQAGSSKNANVLTLKNALPSDLVANVTWPPQGTIPTEKLLASAARMNLKPPLSATFVANGAEFGEYLPSSWGSQGTMVRVDHRRRIIYVKNLKSASTTVSKLFRELDMLEGQGHFGNRHGRSWKVLNKTALLLQCRLDPAPLECRSHWVLSSEIPEAVAREYLTFSFVREPFSRFLSAHREVKSDSWSETVTGTKRLSRKNPHYASQMYQLSRATIGGQRLRLDFIGHVERLDDDWARLLPALASALASLPPRQRALAHVLEKAPTEAGAVQVLPHWREFGTETTTSTSSSSDSSSSTIPPNNPRTSTDSSNPILAVGTAFKEDGNRMASEKSKSTSSGLEYVPPFHDHPAEHFNNFHVLLVCRRYIQDMVCFDLPLPEVCANHPELILGP